MRTCVALSLSLAGCGVDEERFYERFSEELCQAYNKCEEALLVGYWGDIDTCVADQTSIFEVEAATHHAAGCTWREDEARRCLDAIRGRTCAVFQEGEWALECEDLWACP